MAVGRWSLNFFSIYVYVPYVRHQKTVSFSLYRHVLSIYISVVLERETKCPLSYRERESPLSLFFLTCTAAAPWQNDVIERYSFSLPSHFSIILTGVFIFFFLLLQSLLSTSVNVRFNALCKWYTINLRNFNQKPFLRSPSLINFNLSFLYGLEKNWFLDGCGCSLSQLLSWDYG